MHNDSNQEKVMVLFQYPQGGELFYKLAGCLGFKLEILASDMSTKKRHEATKRLNDPG